MNLDQFNNIYAAVEESMFNDAVAKNAYDETIKNRIIHKNSVEYTVGNRPVYVPVYSTDVVNSAGASFNDGNGMFGDISDKLIIAQNNQHLLETTFYIPYLLVSFSRSS